MNTVWRQLVVSHGASGLGMELGRFAPGATGMVAEAARSGMAIVRRAVAASPTVGGGSSWWDFEFVPHPEAEGAMIVTAREVTDDLMARREAEEAQKELSATDIRLGLVQAATGIGIFEWYPESDRQAWSPAQFQLAGFDPDRDAPPSFDMFLDQVHRDDRPLLVAAIDRGFRGSHGPEPLQYRIRRADTGEERWILCQGQCDFVKGKIRPSRVVGVNIDITEQRHRHDALAESETWLRLSFEAAQIFAWDWNIATGRVTWMDGLAEAMGFGRDEFGGTVDAFRALVHPDDAARVEAEISRALSGEAPSYLAEFRMLRSDGSWRTTMSRGLVQRDAQGTPLRMIGIDRDITEERAIEVAQMESERRLRLAMEMAGLSAWEEDRETGRNVWDGSLSALLGLPRQQMVIPHERWFDIIHPDDKARVQALYEAAMQSGARFECEFRVFRADGAVRVLSSRGVLTGLGRMVGVLQDVTELRESEVLLRESHSRFQGMFDTMFEFVGLLTPDGSILKANRSALEFGGVSLEQVKRRKIWETIWFTATPDAAEQVRRAVAHAAMGKFVRYQVTLQGASRTTFVDFSLRPVRDKDGSVILLVAEGRDISELRAAQDALARRQDRLRGALQALPMYAFEVPPDGEHDFVSTAWLEYSGQLEAQAQHCGWVDNVHPDDIDATRAAWRSAKQTGSPFRFEHRLRAADGSYRWFLTRAVCLPGGADGASPRWVGSSVDVSEIAETRDAEADRALVLEARIVEFKRTLVDAARELEAEGQRRVELQAELTQARKLEATGLLTISVAHDFNNVLAAIVGSYNLIRRRTVSEPVLEIVAHGEQATERARSLARQLMSFARHESSAAEMLDIPSVLRATEDLLKHAVGSGVTCRFDIAPDLWPVLADPQALAIALMNLAVNGRDAMGGSGDLRIWVRNVSDAERQADVPPGDHVVIAVTDFGEGMKPEVLLRAQEAFFTTKEHGKGTGLGLPMVFNFARRSGGVVSIESERGVGTTVKIFIPRASVLTSTPDHLAAVRKISDESAWSHGGAHILLVDADVQFRSLATRHLRGLGYTVTEAASAEAAGVSAYAAESMDLLVTGIDLPGEGGVALYSRLRSERPALPVLFLTMGQSSVSVENASVLEKPFRDTALSMAVLKALGRGPKLDTAPIEALLLRLRNPAMRSLLLDWQGAKASGSGCPAPLGINPSKYGLEANSFVAVMEQSEPPLFHYSVIGKELIDAISRRFGGELVSQEAQGDDVLGTLDGVYRRCARTEAPVFQRANYDFGDGDPFSFERLILPASENGETITRLIGIVLFDQ